MSNHIRISPPYKLKTYIFFKNYMTSIGLITFLVSFLFSVGDFAYLDLSALNFSYSKTEQMKGKIIGVASTGVKIGHNSIIAYDFEINHPDIGTYQSTSFSRYAGYKVGDIVDIEYVLKNPEIHRVAGMKNSFVNDLTIILWAFWIIGLTLILLGIRNTREFLKLVENGYVTTATLSKRPTSKVVDHARFFILEFSFLTKEGELVKINKELQNARNILDDKLELIIYSEKNPQKNYFIDRLPKQLKDYIYTQVKAQLYK